ncbi:hypothetical protein TeGR_g12747 [Tetraparma gracilis]|uniref:AGC-kinase C-terminal domain-containing protein n=1 Tax=Tetraparma gracilis TaxID=2962635 RepID=A0ABQ6MJR6_9STRA|nr:hypothetical protein TeGR_g12747 [Tetraparma gracilis]
MLPPPLTPLLSHLACRYEKILSGVIATPPHFSRSLVDLSKKLLQLNQVKRLGNTKGGIHSIMTHKWYGGYDWEGLFHQRLPARSIPIQPSVSNPEDASAFEPWDPSMNMDAPAVSWTPELPDMFSKHTERIAIKKENEERRAEVAAAEDATSAESKGLASGVKSGIKAMILK